MRRDAERDGDMETWCRWRSALTGWSLLVPDARTWPPWHHEMVGRISSIITRATDTRRWPFTSAGPLAAGRDGLVETFSSLIATQYRLAGEVESGSSEIRDC